MKAICMKRHEGEFNFVLVVPGEPPVVVGGICFHPVQRRLLADDPTQPVFFCIDDGPIERPILIRAELEESEWKKRK